MKKIKTFENITFDINLAINFIIDPWRDKLNIDDIIIHYETKLIYFDIYENINDETIDDFDIFFKTLNKYNLKWKFTNKTSSSFRIDYENINKKLLNLEITANKYNI